MGTSPYGCKKGHIFVNQKREPFPCAQGKNKSFPRRDLSRCLQIEQTNRGDGPCGWCAADGRLTPPRTPPKSAAVGTIPTAARQSGLGPALFRQYNPAVPPGKVWQWTP
jgi:hypothetical protein